MANRCNAVAVTSMPIYSTQVVRLDGLMLMSSVENHQVRVRGTTYNTPRRYITTHPQNANNIEKTKGEIRQLVKRMNSSSEPRAAIDTGEYRIQ